MGVAGSYLDLENYQRGQYGSLGIALHEHKVLPGINSFIPSINNIIPVLASADPIASHSISCLILQGFVNPTHLPVHSYLP